MEAKKEVQTIKRYVVAQSETTVDRFRRTKSALADYRDTSTASRQQATQQDTYEFI
jgi:hypothetical protein